MTQLVFPIGSGPLATEAGVLDPIDDSRVEGSETVLLQANIIAGSGSFTPNGDSATVTIFDDDSE